MLLAIDPGKSGAFAWGISELEGVCKIPESPYAISTVLEAINPSWVVLERVHAMPGQGVTSMFSFGRSYGQLEGVLNAMNIPYSEIPPQTWVKFYREKHGIKSSKDFLKKSDWKKCLYACAQKLYPSNKVSLYQADAVLLWHYWKLKGIHDLRNTN